MIVIFAAACALVAVFGFILLVITRRRAILPCGTISMLISGLSIVGILVPALGSLGGSRESRLHEVGFLADEAIRSQVSGATGAFLIPLLAIASGDAISAFVTLRHPGPRGAGTGRRWSANRGRRAILWCIGLALLAEVAQGRRSIIDAAGVASRAQGSGQGILQQLSWLPAVAIIIALEQRGQRSTRATAAIVGACTLILLGGGDRSPFMFLGAYGLIRGITRATTRGLSARQVLGFIGTAYLAAIMISAVPAWRSELTGYTHESLPTIVARSALNPVAGLAEQGAVDTLDGMILVRTLSAEQKAEYPWTRISDAALLFIPSQMWPDKPVPVSGEISQKYLRYGASGMFLSGPGYLSVVIKSPAVEIMIWLVFGFTLSRWLSRLGTSTPDRLVATLLLFFAIYFWFAGDVFIVFFVVALGMVTAGITHLARLTILSERRTSRRSAAEL